MFMVPKEHSPTFSAFTPELKGEKWLAHLSQTLLYETVPLHLRRTSVIDREFQITPLTVSASKGVLAHSSVASISSGLINGDR